MPNSRSEICTSPELQRALKVVETELYWWKLAMEDLAAIFHARYPPIGKRNGWTLHVRRCAKSKMCKMCPHSIVWAQYCYVKNTEQTRKRLREMGKTRAYTFIWARGPKSKQDRFPTGMNISHAVRTNFLEFEEIRAAIMNQHRTLARLRKRLLARQREVVKHLQNNMSVPTDNLEVALIQALSELLLSERPAREAVNKKLRDLRWKYPPSDKRLIHQLDTQTSSAALTERLRPPQAT